MSAPAVENETKIGWETSGVLKKPDISATADIIDESPFNTVRVPQEKQHYKFLKWLIMTADTLTGDKPLLNVYLISKTWVIQTKDKSRDIPANLPNSRQSPLKYT